MLSLTQGLWETFKCVFTEQDDLKSKNFIKQTLLKIKKSIKITLPKFEKMTSVRMMYPTVDGMTQPTR